MKTKEVKWCPQHGYPLPCDKCGMPLSQPQQKEIYEAGKKEVVGEFEPLITKLFEVLDHADFSNGIEANGVDEGRVRANEHIRQLRRYWQSPKDKYGFIKEDKE